MNAFEIFAVAWVPISLAIVIVVAMNADRIDNLFVRRPSRHPAE